MSIDQLSAQPAFAAEVPEAFEERRRAPRVPVVKSAKIFIENGEHSATLSCLVLDESRYGVQAELGMAVELPEQFELEVDGATRRVRRVWTAGSKAGLEFISARIDAAETKRQMQNIADVLEREGLARATEMLGSQEFFDREALRDAAKAAEEAYRRLQTMLTRT